MKNGASNEDASMRKKGIREGKTRICGKKCENNS